MIDNFDSEELNILEKFKNDELINTKTMDKDISDANKTAINTLAKTKQISIRLSEKDLKKLKIKAFESGLSYQTVIGLLIHKYAENKIKIEV